MTEFADRANRIVATAAQIALLQGDSFEATVLQQARATLVETGYDNWNGGTTFFTLMLDIPIPMYAAADAQREELEKSIQRRVSQLVRSEIGNAVTEVVIRARRWPTSRGRQSRWRAPMFLQKTFRPFGSRVFFGCSLRI
jgi:hypothetical protein